MLYLNEDRVAGAASINDIISTYPNGKKILQLVAEKQGIMKDAWLTATKHTRPEMKVGLPLKEARIKAKQIDDQILNLVSGK